tara:strand:+ start:1506 stop:2486 length:981 start_codon:yes stop_codon:yes gene_type:complete
MNPMNHDPEQERHRPVLLAELLAGLAPADGEIYVDATFGAGGYSRAIVEHANCRVIALDRDPDAVAEGANLAAQFGGRLTLRQSRFSEMDKVIAGEGLATVNGVAFDLGVSSMQLDRAERGFAFSKDGPLDMRMSQSGQSAADVVNRASEHVLADIVYLYGGERRARQIARAMVEARDIAPLERTAELAELVARVVPRSGRIHPATKTFQALRIYVNSELDELRLGLETAERILAPEGRLAVVSFHSLEDREVKRFLDSRCGGRTGTHRHLPAQEVAPVPATFRLPRRGAIKPSSREVKENPRARSARLRIAIRTDVPAPTEGMAA